MPVPEEILADPDRYFTEYLPSRIAKRSDVVQRIAFVEAVVQITLEGDGGGDWHFVIKDGKVNVLAGAHEAPSFGLSLDVDTWRAIMKRELEPQAAFFAGKVNVQGDLSRAMQLMPLFAGSGAPRK